MTPDAPTLPRFLSRAEVHERLRPRLTKRAFDNWLCKAMARWGFPSPVRLGERSVGWSEPDLVSWVASRPRGGTFDGRRGAAA